jgi:DNA-binding CsgD family transcriptional regulator/tetratricopeptide (TPR) repeat protein
MAVATGGGGVLLEREESLSSLELSLAGVRASGEGRLVLVSGEGGVGKTSLLRRFCEQLAGTLRVLWGGCDPLFTPRPLGPLLAVAEEAGGGLAELAANAVLPHELVAALVRELRAHTPTVLVLEDVHWADEATLDALLLLAERIESTGALTLASFRDDDLVQAAPLRVVLANLAHRPQRVKLEPFTIGTVQQLAACYGLDGRELHRKTGGNPFFLTEILAAPDQQIPESVREAVLARAARLSSHARRLLDILAVIPGDIQLSLVEALAQQAVEPVEECLSSGVLTSTARHVAFRHELARLSIEEALTATRRRALHRVVLAALSERGSGVDPAHLAHHAEGADDHDAVLRWAPRAGARASASGAHREAAEQYARALRCADRLRPEERIELLELQAEECRISGQFDAAVAAQREALDGQRRRGDRVREADAMRSLSRLLFFAGRTSEGEPLATIAIEMLEQLPAGRELAMAYANLSQRRMVTEDTAEAVAWGSRALRLARRLDDTQVLIYALTNIGAAQVDAHQARGWHRLKQAMALAEANNLEDHAGRLFAFQAQAAVRQRRFAQAERDLQTGLAYCSERGLDTWRTYLLAQRARMELQRGQWDDSAESAATVLRDPRTPTVARGWALATLALVRARRGDPDAEAPLREAHELVRATAEPMRTAPVASAMAESAWLTGDRSAVAQATSDALDLVLRKRALWLASELAYWRWQAGCIDDLQAMTTRDPFLLSIAGEATAAARAWHQLGCPYEAALALSDSDDPGDQRRSVAELQALGARPAAAIVARTLRNRGVRSLPRGPYTRSRTNPASLTTRELEVLALLAAGLHNAQIAERLIVSTRTVEHHVSAILRKLNVTTRNEASVTAVRLGILDHEQNTTPNTA